MWVPAEYNDVRGFVHNNKMLVDAMDVIIILLYAIFNIDEDLMMNRHILKENKNHSSIWEKLYKEKAEGKSHYNV